MTPDITDTQAQAPSITSHKHNEQVWQAPSKPIPPLTSKQKQFVSHIVNDGMSKSQAYKQAYDTGTDRIATIHEGASRTASLPQVKLELSKYAGTAENTLLTVMDYSTKYGMDNTKEGASYAGVAVSVAKDILDRVHGKATQRIEQQSTSVSINIDLSGITPVTDN